MTFDQLINTVWELLDETYHKIDRYIAVYQAENGPFESDEYVPLQTPVPSPAVSSNEYQPFATQHQTPPSTSGYTPLQSLTEPTDDYYDDWDDEDEDEYWDEDEEENYSYGGCGSSWRPMSVTTETPTSQKSLPNGYTPYK